MYYRNAQSALVVYDITKASSLVKAKHWVAELQRQASPGIVIALVGNKLDLVEDEEEGGEVVQQEGEGEGDGDGEGMMFVVAFFFLLMLESGDVVFAEFRCLYSDV